MLVRSIDTYKCPQYPHTILVILRMIACCFLYTVFMLHSPITRAETQTVTYLENSDHELTIYYITGREPGKTMMIIGGIQGDEPGGYLSADLYADMILETGNLIVVPRANFNSIRKNQRGVNGDMNRRFSEQTDDTQDTEQHIVDILKSLIAQSDVLLNLHDGSGFYYPTYISDQQNPMCFGQSIIADASVYQSPDTTVIDLEGHASRVIERVNQNIRDTDHYFHFNNHDTISPLTEHEEQRKSATYYALTEVGIPAFGIETSKSISPVTTKVKYQTLVINAFMAEFGIIPEHPSISLPEPELDYLVIEIVGEQNHFAVKNGETLTVPAGSSVHVTDIVANFRRGLSIDIDGYGDDNDLGQVSVINRPTGITVYKDAFRCGEITIDVAPINSLISVQQVMREPERLDHVMFAVDGKNIVVSEGDTLHIVRGDIISVTDAETSAHNRNGIRVNFVGFVGNKSVNDAEDRGYSIDSGHDLLDRFSLDDEHTIYEVNVENLDTKDLIGTVYVRLTPPQVTYLILERGDGTTVAVEPGTVMHCDASEQLTVLFVISNINAPPYVETFAANPSGGLKQLTLPQSIDISPDTVIRFRRADIDLGVISIRISG